MPAYQERFTFKQLFYVLFFIKLKFDLLEVTLKLEHFFLFFYFSNLKIGHANVNWVLNNVIFIHFSL